MAYREPKLQIFQDFEAAVAGGAQPLFACCVGPNYGLHRFDVESEKATLGTYDNSNTQTYLWPDKAAGGVVDTDSAKIQLEDTFVRYYSEEGDVTLDFPESNRIVSAGTVYKTNAAAVRDAEFGKRDVQVDDIVLLENASIAGGSFLTQVVGFDGETIPAILDSDARLSAGSSPGDDTAGATPTTALPAGIQFIGGLEGYDVSAYKATPYGITTDMYTASVLLVAGDGSTDGGLIGTRIQITSKGGDAETVTLKAEHWDDTKYTIDFGKRKATFSFTATGSMLLPGDSWEVTLSQDFTEIGAMSVTEEGGAETYSGSASAQYILTFVKGGTVGTDALRVSYMTNNGSDVGGIVEVASDAGPVDIAIGSFGAQVTLLSGEEFVSGATYSFDVVGTSVGALKTLILRDNVPLIDDSIDIDLSLHVMDTITLPASAVTLTIDDITVDANILVSTEELLGTVNFVPVVNGTLYADYREMLTDNCNQLSSIERSTNVEDLLGPVSDDNPLAKAVSLALANSNGNAVYYIPTCGDDLSAYADALDASTQNDAVYSMVPLSNDEEIKALFRTHVLERSDAINNQWRIAWLANNASDIVDVYTELSPGVDITSVVTEFTTVQNRKVTSVGALYVTTGVEPGDMLRINFSINASTGETKYDEYVIDRVLSETELLLLSSVADPVPSIPVKTEVWRNQSRTEYADSLAMEPAAHDSRRVYMVYADNPVDGNGNALELFYVAAALAGQRSGAAPHAPLSQVTLLGVDLDPVQGWSRTNLNTIASGGNWIVDKDYTGRVFTRHQISTVTNPDAFNEREQTKTTNIDDISRFFYANTNDLFGSGNVSPAMLSLIGQRVDSLISQISNRPYPDKIGPQMLDAEVLELAQDEVFRDTIRVVIDPDMPDPLNVLQVRFTVS